MEFDIFGIKFGGNREPNLLDDSISELIIKIPLKKLLSILKLKEDVVTDVYLTNDKTLVLHKVVADQKVYKD